MAMPRSSAFLRQRASMLPLKSEPYSETPSCPSGSVSEPVPMLTSSAERMGLPSKTVCQWERVCASFFGESKRS